MRLMPLVVLLSLASAANTEVFHSVHGAGSGVSFHAHTTFHDFEGTSSGVSAYASIEGQYLHDVQVTVPVDSIRTGNSQRDADMRSGHYLDAAHHPDISFHETSFNGAPIVEAQSGTGRLSGLLTVRGEARSVTIPVQYAWMNGRLTVTGDFPVDIRDYGMKAPRVMLVQRMDPHVQVHFNVTLAPSTGTTG